MKLRFSWKALVFQFLMCFIIALILPTIGVTQAWEIWIVQLLACFFSPYQVFYVEEQSSKRTKGPEEKDNE